MRTSTLAAACCFFATALCLPQTSSSSESESESEVTTSASQSFLEVKTNNGLIRGHPAPGSEAVIEYLGIPFAKPPVGDLRFAAPQKYVNSSTYVASQFGYDCPLSPSRPVDYPGMTPQAQQIIRYFASGAGTPQSEDCLTLNIWSKPTAKSDKKQKPVLVFFYGGRFAIGNTNSPFYNGKYFANAEDIIVVTVNYRLNIFGFPGSPDLPQQNLGLRDQRAAVEWLRDNIASFGGNPKQITISGQSSGGVAVDYWSYAYRSDPIVKGLVAHSGNAFSFPVNAPGVPAQNWNTVVAAVGCSNATDVVACMRTVNWQDIKTAAAAIRPRSSSSVLRSIPPFYPQPDEQIVFSDYLSRAQAGQFAKTPMLLGNTENEDGYYRIPAYGNGVVPTDEQVRNFLLESFTCPNSFTARTRDQFDVPVWWYRYFADWDNTRLYPTSGAYHGTDLHMLFGASADVSGLPTTADQRELTRVMQRAWAAFVANPAKGLEKAPTQWPEFDAAKPDKKNLIRLGYNNSPKPDFVKPSVYDAPCSTVTMGALATGA